MSGCDDENPIIDFRSSECACGIILLSQPPSLPPPSIHQFTSIRKLISHCVFVLERLFCERAVETAYPTNVLSVQVLVAMVACLYVRGVRFHTGQEATGTKIVVIQESNAATPHEKPVRITGDKENCMVGG